MELDKLQILQRQTCSHSHGVTVTRAGVSRSTRKVRSAVTAGSQDSFVASEPVEGTVFHVNSKHTDTFAVLHEKVESKVLDEEIGVMSERLTVQGVENGVTGSVSGGGTSVSLTTLAVLKGLTPESSLVDLTLLSSGEGHTVVLELWAM